MVFSFLKPVQHMAYAVHVRQCMLIVRRWSQRSMMHTRHLVILYLRHKSTNEALLDSTSNAYTGRKQAESDHSMAGLWLLCLIGLLSFSGEPKYHFFFYSALFRYKQVQNPHTGGQSCVLPVVPTKRHAAISSRFSSRQQGVT